MVMLDIQTPRGQESARYEEAAVSMWERLNPGWSFWPTPKDEPAVVDGIILRHGKIAGLVEVKARDVDLETFRGAFESEWLVTHRKLEDARRLAAGLCVPLVGFLYLIPSRTLLTCRITDKEGEFLLPMRLERTETQATINGGLALRTNAFLSMETAKIFSETVAPDD